MAAVLSGLGPGNKMIAVGEAEVVSKGGEGPKTLWPVTVNWANDQDRNYAEEWSDNVTHGLFEEPSYVSEPQPDVPPRVAQPAEAPQAA